MAKASMYFVPASYKQDSNFAPKVTTQLAYPLYYIVHRVWSYFKTLKRFYFWWKHHVGH